MSFERAHQQGSEPEVRLILAGGCQALRSCADKKDVNSGKAVSRPRYKHVSVNSAKMTGKALVRVLWTSGLGTSYSPFFSLRNHYPNLSCKI